MQGIRLSGLIVFDDLKLILNIIFEHIFVRVRVLWMHYCSICSLH